MSVYDERPWLALYPKGQPADIGGYYQPDFAKLTAIMRPSKTLNAALESV